MPGRYDRVSLWRGFLERTAGFYRVRRRRLDDTKSRSVFETNRLALFGRRRSAAPLTNFDALAPRSARLFWSPVASRTLFVRNATSRARRFGVEAIRSPQCVSELAAFATERTAGFRRHRAKATGSISFRSGFGDCGFFGCTLLRHHYNGAVRLPQSDGKTSRIVGRVGFLPATDVP
jgi:hypothetical protein